MASGAASHSAVGKRTLVEALQRDGNERDRGGGGAPGIAPGRRTQDFPPSSASRAEQLPAPVQAQMGAAFGLDLSGVDVYRDSARAVEASADAFASDGALHFAPGTYDPSGVPGLELIGHEVAHLAQQTDGRATGAQAKGAGESPALEAEADDLGGRAARGEAGLLGDGALRTPARVAVVQRKPTKWLDIKSNGAGMIWEPHRTSINKHGQSEATGAALDVEPAKVVYGPRGKAGGTSVDARNVGAQQRPGQPLSPLQTGAYDQAASSAASAKSLGPPAAYETVAMFPQIHGGVGEERNALVLPPTAAEALRDLQAMVTALVNAGTFVDYRVGVAEQVEDNLSYAATISVEWDQVDPTGNPIPGTRGQSTIVAPSPRAHGEGNGVATSTPQQIGPDRNQARPGTKAERHPDARAAELKTRIDFEPLTSDQDGTRMTAHVLGPDHEVGAQPQPKKVWSQRTAALAEASGNKMDYVAGHLLNHHLGGPGNDPRNLAPIPADVNDLHESSVEAIIKRLVNTEGRWVYYDVQVSYGTDTYQFTPPPPKGKSTSKSKSKTPTSVTPITRTVNYPSKFTCTWWQIDPAGKQIAGTEGQRELPIKPPTDYAQAPIEQGKTLPKLAAPGPEKLGPDAKNPVAGGAKTSLGFDEVLLDDDKTLKGQVAVMQPLVESLTKLGLNMHFETNGALHQTVAAALAAVKPNVAEVTARDEIERLSKELHTGAGSSQALGNARPLVDALRKQLEAFSREVQDRSRRATEAGIQVANLQYAVPNAAVFAQNISAVSKQAERDLATVNQGAQAAIEIAERAILEQQGTMSELRFTGNLISEQVTGELLSDDLTPNQIGMQTQRLFGGYVEQLHVPPMSPNQLDTYWHEENDLNPEEHRIEPTTSRGKSEQLHEHRRNPVRKTQNGSKKRKLNTEELPPRMHGATRLLELIERASRWPSCEGVPDLTGDALTIGRAIEAVVPLWTTARASVELTVKALYESKPKALIAYLHWATKWIDDRSLEFPMGLVDNPQSVDFNSMPSGGFSPQHGGGGNFGGTPQYGGGGNFGGTPQYGGGGNFGGMPQYGGFNFGGMPQYGGGGNFGGTPQYGGFNFGGTPQHGGGFNFGGTSQQNDQGPVDWTSFEQPFDELIDLDNPRWPTDPSSNDSNFDV